MNPTPDNAAAPAPKPVAKRRGPSPLGVITSALGLFFIVLTLLAIQVRSGHDPSLGPGLATPAANSQPAGGKGTATSTATQEAGAIVSRTSPAPPP